MISPLHYLELDLCLQVPRPHQPAAAPARLTMLLAPEPAPPAPAQLATAPARLATEPALLVTTPARLALPSTTAPARLVLMPARLAPSSTTARPALTLARPAMAPAHLPLQPALLPLLLSDRLLPAVPRLSPAALAAPSTRDRLPSSPSPTRTPCGPVASLALHSLWTDSTSTLCPCRLCPHLFVELCRIPIGAPLCKLSMML